MDGKEMKSSSNGIEKSMQKFLQFCNQREMKIMKGNSQNHHPTTMDGGATCAPNWKLSNQIVEISNGEFKMIRIQKFANKSNENVF